MMDDGSLEIIVLLASLQAMMILPPQQCAEQNPQILVL